MRKYIEEIEIENSKYIHFRVLPYWDDFEVIADIIENKIKAKVIKKKEGVFWKLNTYKKGDIIFDLYYNEDLDGNFLRGIEPSLFKEQFEALRLIAKEILTNLNVNKFKYKFYQELDDILRAIQWQRLIIGKVKGSFIIYYKNLIPDSFDIYQKNDNMSGIIFRCINKDRRGCVFNFENSSIYNFLCELEYFRNNSYNNELFIETIEIFFNFKNIKFFRPNVDSEKYKRTAKNEINDLKNCYEIERVFSGSLFIKYLIKNLLTNKIEQGSGEYPSIYSFLIKLERLLREKNPLKAFEIKLELSKLNDSE